MYIRLPADTSRRPESRCDCGESSSDWPERYRYAAHPIGPPTFDRRPERLHPCVYPNWDNTPRAGTRRARPDGFRPPTRFGRTSALPRSRFANQPPETRLLFVKSWNEWAEGNYLEPDLEHGHGFLRVIAEEIL